MALAVKNPPANAGDIKDVGSIPGSGRSPGGGHDDPLQYSCLEKPMDRAAWWATVHGVSQSQSRLSDLACMQVLCSCLAHRAEICTNHRIVCLRIVLARVLQRNRTHKILERKI